MRSNLSFLTFLLVLMVSFSCKQGDKNTSGKILQLAKGAPGEIILVIDSATYEGKVGDAVKSTFKGDIEWLSRPQSQFTVRVVQPSKVNNVLRGSKNLVYVTVINDQNRGNRILRNNFTEESISRIKKDSSLYMFTKKDEFARGQTVVHLFGLTENDLVRNLLENQEKIREHFNDIEIKRTQQKLFAGSGEKGIEQVISKNLNCHIQIPYGYEIAIQKDNFIWLRFLDPQVDRSIFITYTDYNSQNQFSKDSILQFRDSVAREHIFGDPDKPISYMVTETENFSVFYDELNFNGKYTAQLRGLWKTNNLSMGGPFISYSLVDESQRRFYYVEGFLYAPGRQQREYVRELEAILQTFRTSEKNS